MFSRTLDPFCKRTLQNLVLFAGALVCSPLLRTFCPSLSANPELMLGVGLLSFWLAAVVINDYVSLSPPGAHVDPVSAGSLNALPRFWAGVRHTAHAWMWPHLLNIFFMMGYPALYFVTKSHPACMSLWFSVAFLVALWNDRRASRFLVILPLATMLVGIFLFERDTGTVQVEHDELQHVDKFADVLTEMVMHPLNAVALAIACAGWLVSLVVQKIRVRANGGSVFAMGLVSMLVGSIVLILFCQSCTTVPVQDGQYRIDENYSMALRHTAILWLLPHVLNIFCPNGFACIFHVTKSHATSLGAWLLMTFAVPLVWDLMTVQTMMKPGVLVPTLTVMAAGVVSLLLLQRREKVGKTSRE